MKMEEPHLKMLPRKVKLMYMRLVSETVQKKRKSTTNVDTKLIIRLNISRIA